jgi:hypothetical protein
LILLLAGANTRVTIIIAVMAIAPNNHNLRFDEFIDSQSLICW